MPILAKEDCLSPSCMLSQSADCKKKCVNNLVQVRGFESTGLSREQAETLTQHMTELLCTNKEKITEAFASKFAMEKVIPSLRLLHCQRIFRILMNSNLV